MDLEIRAQIFLSEKRVLLKIEMYFSINSHLVSLVFLFFYITNKNKKCHERKCKMMHFLENHEKGLNKMTSF